MLIILLIRVVLGLFAALEVLLIGFIAISFYLFLELLTYWLIFGLHFLDSRSAVSLLELLNNLLLFAMNFCLNLLSSFLFLFEIFCWHIICWFFHLLCFRSLFLFLLLFLVFYCFIIEFYFFWRLYSCIFYYLFTPLLLLIAFSWNVTTLNIHLRMDWRMITNQIFF